VLFSSGKIDFHRFFHTCGKLGWETKNAGGPPLVKVAWQPALKIPHPTD
jgi:hypothetical protein